MAGGGSTPGPLTSSWWGTISPGMSDQPQFTTAVAVDQPSARVEAPVKVLSEAAKRALAEAAERRAALDAKAAELAANPELHGRGGADPVRYDDWEVGGIAVDF